MKTWINKWRGKILFQVFSCNSVRSKPDNCKRQIHNQLIDLAYQRGVIEAGSMMINNMPATGVFVTVSGQQIMKMPYRKNAQAEHQYKKGRGDFIGEKMKKLIHGTKITNKKEPVDAGSRGIQGS